MVAAPQGLAQAAGSSRGGPHEMQATADLGGMAENCNSVLGGEANGVRDVETLNNLEARRRRCHWRFSS